MLVCERDLVWALLWWDHTNTWTNSTNPMGYSQCSSVSHQENFNCPLPHTKQQGDKIQSSLIFFVIYIVRKGVSIPTYLFLDILSKYYEHMSYGFTLPSHCPGYSWCCADPGFEVVICLCSSAVIGWSSCKDLSWINQALPFRNKIAIKPFWPFIFFFQSQATEWLKEKQLQKRKSIQSLQPHTSHGTETV